TTTTTTPDTPTSTTSSTSTTTSTAPTTTTVSTTTTTTSTSLPGVCTCAGGVPDRLTFTLTTGSGSCGSLKNGFGTSFLDLACGGLYFGGTSDAVPLPALVPDTGVSSVRVTACNGTTLGLGATTQADTGSLRTCTGAGCLFQAPLPIPDCGAGGSCESARCVGGSDAGFGCITNDDCPGGTCNTLIQTCPICNATTHVCNGGPNDGLGCTPGDSQVSDAYPTSHDCPPPASLTIGAPL